MGGLPHRKDPEWVIALNDRMGENDNNKIYNYRSAMMPLEAVFSLRGFLFSEEEACPKLIPETPRGF
jgi:hypothetical protein